MRPGVVEKLVFAVSATVLIFFYGYGSGMFGWFPASLVNRSLVQTAVYLQPPHYVVARVHSRSGARVVQDDGQVGESLTLIASHFPDWDWGAGLRLIDRKGGTVHEWRTDPARLFAGVESIRGIRTGDSRGVHGSYLFPNGDVLINIDYAGIARLDACGEVLWKLANQAHHSIARADDGTFWVPITSSAVRPTSARFPGGYPGLDRPVNHDRLLHLSADGDALDTISVIDILYRNEMVRYLPKGRVVVPTDLLHVNDVEPLSAELAAGFPLFEPGDLLVSVRASDLVFVFDPKTEIVKWHTSDPFVQQHDPDFLEDGWIGVFDNNNDDTQSGSLLGGSRIVAIQPHTGAMQVLFPTVDSDLFYSSILGKWQLLENGNMLLTEGRASRVVEVAPDGRTVWEWIGQPFDESHAVEVTEGTRYEMTINDVADWPCATNSGG